MTAVPRRSVAKDTRRPKDVPTRTRLSVDERRAQLVRLGVEAFSERPFDEVSIDDVAQRAAISKGLLYHYFPTKRDFYVATIREVATRLLIETDAPTTLDAHSRLLKGLDGYLAFADSHQKVYASLLRGGIGSDAEVTRVVEETREALIERIFTEFLSDTEQRARFPLVRLVLRGWVGFVEASCLEWLETRHVDRQALRALWIGLLVDGVARVDPDLAWIAGASIAAG